MNGKIKLLSVLFVITIFCIALTGCDFIQDKISKYSSDKVECSLNKDNVTEFTYKSDSYTILEDAVNDDNLGNWIGYIRKLTAIDENGKILVMQNLEKSTFSSLKDLGDSAPDAAYIIPFSNVYEAKNDSSYLIVEANGVYHKAILTSKITDKNSIFNYKTSNKSANGDFTINPNDATQLICNGTTYQVTSEVVSESNLGNYLDSIAQEITFDNNTKKILTKDDLKKIDWNGKNKQKRETWFYTDVYEMSGTDSDNAVAVEVNDEFHVARTGR